MSNMENKYVELTEQELLEYKEKNKHRHFVDVDDLFVHALLDKQIKVQKQISFKSLTPKQKYFLCKAEAEALADEIESYRLNWFISTTKYNEEDTDVTEEYKELCKLMAYAVIEVMLKTMNPLNY